MGETPWNRPTRIIKFFAINQEGVDQSFSSSNSTEISMRRFYAQNFITIGLALEELSCKRPAILTDSRVYSLFEYTKMVVYRLSYLITYTCFVNESESAYASSFFSSLLITGNRRHVDSKKKNVTCKLFLFFSYGTAISHASVITIIRDIYLNTRFLYFFSLLLDI